MRLSRLLALALVATTLAAPARAETKLTRLGTDPAGDSAPALDVTYLDVGRSGANLEIRIGVANMIPPGGGYPLLPGIEWIFDVGRNTFIAEGVATTSPEGSFYLFKKKGDSYEQLESPHGTYNWADGYIMMHVPLKDIGARSGTLISGVGKKGTEDVDAHVHVGPNTFYPDTMATTKDYVVP
ncbi:MAG: hypothetical protein ACRDKT_04300 [Actinomycetota bacterium]